MRLYFIFSVFILAVQSVGAQVTNRNNETVYSYRHAVASPDGRTSELSLQQLDGKIVILDFWNRFCISCIRQMPKLYTLQEAYKENVVILPVTADILEDVKQTFERQRGGQYELKLPTIYADSALTSFYNIQSYPEAIWLDRDGSFLAKTAGSAVNDEMIQSVLKGDVSFLDRISRVSRLEFYKESEQMEQTDAVTNSPILFSVRLTPYNKTLSSDYIIYKKQISNRTRYALVNRTLDEMVRSLYSDTNNMWVYDTKNRRTVVSGKISRRFKNRDSLLAIEDFKEKTLFRESNLFCLFVEAEDDVDIGDIKTLALQVLEKALGVKTGLKYEQRHATVLETIPQRASMARTVGNNYIELRRQVSIRKVSDLLNYINNRFVEEPLWVLADSSAIDQPVGLIIDKTKSYKETISDLRDLGFEFDERPHQVQVLTID